MCCVPPLPPRPAYLYLLACPSVCLSIYLSLPVFPSVYHALLSPCLPVYLFLSQPVCLQGWVSVCMPVSLIKVSSACLSVCRPVYLSVCLYRFISLSFCLSVWPYKFLLAFIFLSPCPPICLSVCLPVCLFICLRACLSSYLPVYLFVCQPVCLPAVWSFACSPRSSLQRPAIRERSLH